MLFVMTGPSGCGKSTLVKRVLNELEEVEFSVSYTTRKKRASEVEGQDYYFISEKDSWAVLCGCAGYALIREGQVVDVIITSGN